jgi:hypothetical protein
MLSEPQLHRMIPQPRGREAMSFDFGCKRYEFCRQIACRGGVGRMVRAHAIAILALLGLLAAVPDGAAQPPAAATTAPHDGVGIVARVDQRFRLAEPAWVLQKPDDSAAPLGMVRPGAQLMVVGVVEGRHWLQIMLPDESSAGYIHAEAITAAASAVGMSLEAEAAVPEEVSGVPGILDTATLLIDRQVVHLADVEGLPDPYATELQKNLTSALTCRMQGVGQYACQMPDGTDLALVELVNGVARTTEKASAEYRHQQEDAQKNHRGVWGTAGNNPTVSAFAGLARWVGRMPSGEDPRAPTDPGIGSIFGEPGVADAIGKALGPAVSDRVLYRWIEGTVVERSGTMLHVLRCRQRACDREGIDLFIDIASATIQACVWTEEIGAKTNESYWFENDGLPRSLPGFACQYHRNATGTFSLLTQFGVPAAPQP